MSKKTRWCPHPECGLLITPSSKKGVRKHFIKAHGRSPTDAELNHSENFGPMPEEREKRMAMLRKIMAKPDKLRAIPIACEAVAWEFKCPKRWVELEATEREDVRHCTSCSQQVYLCTSAADLNKYARRGLCVAWGQKVPKENIETMTLGLPIRDFTSYDKDG